MVASQCGLTSDYAGLYILPNGRIYERVEAGSTWLGAHLRHCQAEPRDCKGLFAKQLGCSGTNFGLPEVNEVDQNGGRDVGRALGEDSFQMQQVLWRGLRAVKCPETERGFSPPSAHEKELSRESI